MIVLVAILVYGTAAQLSRLFKCLANRYIASATGCKKESRERILVQRCLIRSTII